MGARCEECGFVHPPSEPGKCPMAKAQKVEDELKTIVSNVLSDGILLIKEALVKNMKDSPEKHIRRVVSRCLNIINNHEHME